jgi:hypothetical protein
VKRDQRVLKSKWHSEVVSVLILIN